MQIIYLYINEYKNLKKQNLNFGGKYRFTFRESSKELKEEQNELYVENFYNSGNGKENNCRISNVTSIIGENGTGKSSVLDFITEHLVSGSPLMTEVILVTFDKGEYVIYSTYEGVTYNRDLIFKFKFLKNDSPEGINFGYDLRGLDNTDIIFFSNVFDGSPGKHVEGLRNISTNNLVRRDYQILLEQKIIEKGGDTLRAFFAAELFRQLRFITNDVSKEKIPFKLPEFLFIKPFRPIVEAEPKEFKRASELILKNFFVDYFSDAKGLPEESRHYTGSYQLIAYSLINLLRELKSLKFFYEDYLEEIFSLLNFVKDEKLVLYERVENRLEYFFETIEKYLSEHKILNDTILDLINNTREFSEYILDAKLDLVNHQPSENSPGAYFMFSEGSDSDGKLKLFIKKYLKTFSINPYLEFSWRSLSSGETALLNIFSRFFSLSDNEKLGNDLKQNIIILIDEGDLYLHPAWQKGLLNSLLELLPEFYSGKSSRTARNLQIIFTTNSPIPASDLFTYNTIFLEKVQIKGESQTVVKDGLRDQKETFAANIHTLLSDSFFIKDGLIGNFAKNVLNNIIKRLHQRENLSYDERERIRKIIHQVGEPILKNKLVQMYNDRFNLEIHERLDAIEKRLPSDD